MELRPDRAETSQEAPPVDEAVAAATVILGRDRSDRLELLMLRRDSRLTFAGGMWVFPGGRVDPADFGDAPEDLAMAEARAAARESLEEAGLAVDPTTLVRLSHWTPPPRGPTHRFSTAFFVARAPEGDVVVDDGEIRAHRWVTAADALTLQRSGEVELVPPTFITLCRLADLHSVEELVARAERGPVEHFVTRIGADGDTLVALYHGDSGYDDGDATRPGARHRLVMAAGGWQYLRDG